MTNDDISVSVQEPEEIHFKAEMTNDDISVSVQEPEEIHFKAEYAEIIKAISPTIDVESTPEKTTLIITDINGTKRVEIPHYNKFPPSGVTWGDLLGSENQTEQEVGE